MIPEMTYWQSSPSLNTVLLKLLNNDAQPQELSVEMGLAVLACDLVGRIRGAMLHRRLATNRHDPNEHEMDKGRRW